MEFKHLPVMAKECINGLDIKPDGIYVDGTLGGAGHSILIAEKLDKGRLIAVDKDTDALEASAERLAPYKDKVTYVYDDYKNLIKNLDDLKIDKVDGILLDLGVSSYQLDSAERGFSYMQDANLDMRMDKGQYLTAFNVVNEYNEIDLANLIYEYGEEKFSRKIASNIVRIRETTPIRTTLQLAKIIENSIPAAIRWKGGNPCKRTFQAIRIEVNNELRNLDKALREMCFRLNEGGRICVITFHSLEDRIVKRAFQELEKKCICPPKQPICTCSKRKEIEILTKKPIIAGEDELSGNSRSQSAKLRIAKRI